MKHCVKKTPYTKPDISSKLFYVQRKVLEKDSLNNAVFIPKLHFKVKPQIWKCWILNGSQDKVLTVLTGTFQFNLLKNM